MGAGATQQGLHLRRAGSATRMGGDNELPAHDQLRRGRREGVGSTRFTVFS